MITGLAQGTTALVTTAVTINKEGPKINKARLDTLGMISSFINIFTPSANGCNKPPQPARLVLFYLVRKAANFLSHNVAYAAAPKQIRKTPHIIALYITNAIILN
jgi:hypothetical protein